MHLEGVASCQTWLTWAPSCMGALAVCYTLNLFLGSAWLAFNHVFICPLRYAFCAAGFLRF